MMKLKNYIQKLERKSIAPVVLVKTHILIFLEDSLRKTYENLTKHFDITQIKYFV